MGNGPEKEKSLGTMAEKPYTMCTFFGVPAGKYINTERTPDCVAVMSQRRAGNLPFRPDPHSTESLSQCVYMAVVANSLLPAQCRAVARCRKELART